MVEELSGTDMMSNKSKRDAGGNHFMSKIIVAND
jgi:hypothetical protein